MKNENAQKIEKIENALHEILQAREAIDLKRVKDYSEPVEPISVNAFVHRSIEEIEFSSLVNDPVFWGMRKAMKALGAALFEITGSTEEMSTVLKHVAMRVPDQYLRRANRIDKAWDGIGDEKDRWFS